jgi:hypothetical protein
MLATSSVAEEHPHPKIATTDSLAEAMLILKSSRALVLLHCIKKTQGGTAKIMVYVLCSMLGVSNRQFPSLSYGLNTNLSIENLGVPQIVSRKNCSIIFDKLQCLIHRRNDSRSV